MNQAPIETRAIGLFRLARLIGADRAKGHTQSEEVLRADWVTVDRLKTVSLHPLERAFVWYMERQRRAVLQAIDERFKAQAPDPIVQAIFDVDLWDQVIQKDFPPLWTAMMGDGFDTGLARVNVEGISFNVNTEPARQVLREVIDKTKLINQTTAGELEEIIRRGLLEEQSWDDIAETIHEQFQDWKLSRAKTVARTSGTPAFESGQEIAYESAGVGLKRWLSRRDGLVRGRDEENPKWDHWTPDGDEVAVGGTFTISGEELRFPGDPNGSAGNVIWCRCTSLPVIK